jgi:hypothetical protein
MALVCYAWDDTPFPWSDTPFTWKEGCVIEKLVQGAGGMQSIRRFKEKIKELDKDEKETLINLFLRLEVDEIVIEKEMTKGKNKQIKIRLKDVEVLMKEQRFINVNVKNID